MKHQVRRNFSQASASYAKVATVQQQVAQRLTRKLFATTPALVTRPATTLEIGCGNGMLTKELLPKLSSHAYIATDIAEGMFHAPDFPDHPALSKIITDGEALPFTPDSFDLIVSSSTFQWFANPAASLPAMVDLLKPGGILAFAVFTTGTLHELAASSDATGFGSHLPMRDPQHYIHSLTSGPSASNLSVQHWQDSQAIHFPSVSAFLKAHRQTGAHCTKAGAGIGKQRYREFCRYYEYNFKVEHGIPATFSTLYVVAQKG